MSTTPHSTPTPDRQSLDFRALAEVVRSLPLVQAIVSTARETARELADNRQERRELRRRSSEIQDHERGKDLLERLRDRGEELHDDLRLQTRELAELGGILVDPLEGHVDFASHVAGDPVLLCWRPGDRGISHYHELDQGCEERQPLRRTASAALE